MRRLNSHLVGIDQGQIVLFEDFETDGPMWAGTGPRERRSRITFSETYRNAPVVYASLSMWDMDQKHNMRADIAAENIDETGFELVFRTWGDTRVARVRAGWLAIGELARSDEWDLY
ncbi:MAG: H-type lectin domain-containing protein [Pseudomonadota bacterium]